MDLTLIFGIVSAISVALNAYLLVHVTRDSKTNRDMARALASLSHDMDGAVTHEAVAIANKPGVVYAKALAPLVSEVVRAARGAAPNGGE